MFLLKVSLVGLTAKVLFFASFYYNLFNKMCLFFRYLRDFLGEIRLFGQKI